MVGPLPMATEISPAEVGEAEGCIQCQRGSKLVLFVTGKCHWGCDYCPLSDNRRETPDMFANERRCNDWDEVIEEARAMNATGTGITGGDPMLDMKKSLEAVKQLKAAFGPQHHIHLYTSIPFNPVHSKQFADAGLDEIRFHLLDGKLSRYLEVIDECSNLGIDVGIELPCEPDRSNDLFALLDEMNGTSVKFLNLNELEITVGNQENMDVRGFNLSGGMTAAAEGSFELATKLREYAKGMSFHVKFCTASFKDAGQLRARFRRRAEVTLRPYEIISSAIVSAADKGNSIRLATGSYLIQPSDKSRWFDRSIISSLASFSSVGIAPNRIVSSELIISYGRSVTSARRLNLALN